MNKLICFLFCLSIIVSCKKEKLPDELKGKWVHVYSVKQSEIFTTSPPGYHTAYTTVPQKENCFIELSRKKILVNDNGQVAVDEKWRSVNASGTTYTIRYGVKQNTNEFPHITVELSGDTLKVHEFFPYDGYHYDDGHGHDIGEHYVNYFVRQ